MQYKEYHQLNKISNKPKHKLELSLSLPRKAVQTTPVYLDVGPRQMQDMDFILIHFPAIITQHKRS